MTGLGEVEGGVERLGDVLMAREFAAIVGGDGQHLGAQCREPADHCFRDRLCRLVGHRLDDHIF